MRTYASLFRGMLLFAMFAAAAGTGVCGTGKVFDVAKFGAKGDGVALDTAAIQRAIDAAATSGGTVVFSPGTYLTGSLFVKSGVTLNVGKGVTLMGSQELKDYPLRPTRVAGIEMTWPAALVNVYEQHDAAVVGEGTIDGHGNGFWAKYWAQRAIDEPKGIRWATDYDVQRPRLIVVFNSSNVKVGGGLLLKRPGFWTVHICYSHDVTVDGVTIRGNDETVHDGKRNGRGPSTDGVDIDSSRKIVVAHADIENNDDALCLKAGRDADGLRVNRPTEDVVIRDSVIRVGAAGVTFGSETSGGFRNIEIYNLRVLAGAPSGILFKSAPARGGFAENIRIHDLTLEGTPVVLRMTMNWNPNYSTSKIPAGMTEYPEYWKVLTTPVSVERGLQHVKYVHIWNVKAVGAKEIFDVEGNPLAPPREFELDHWDVSAQSAGQIANVANWKLHDVVFHVADGSSVAVKDSKDVDGLPK